MDDGVTLRPLPVWWTLVYARSGNRLHSVQPCLSPRASHGDSSMASFLPTRSQRQRQPSEVNEVLEFLTVIASAKTKKLRG